MASSTQFLFQTGGSSAASPATGFPLASGANSFTTAWLDKRSATTIGISIVFYGPNAPVGTAVIQTSNAPEPAGGPLGGPNNGGDDAAVYPGSQQTIVENTSAGGTLYGAQWQIANLAARWVRVAYTAGSSVAGLSVNVYATVPFESA